MKTVEDYIDRQYVENRFTKLRLLAKRHRNIHCYTAEEISEICSEIKHECTDIMLELYRAHTKYSMDRE